MTSSSCTPRPPWPPPRPTPRRPAPTQPRHRRRAPSTRPFRRSRRQPLPATQPRRPRLQHQPRRARPRLPRPTSLLCRHQRLRQNLQAIHRPHLRPQRLPLPLHRRPLRLPRAHHRPLLLLLLRHRHRHLLRRRHQRQRHRRRRPRCPRPPQQSRRLAQPCPPGFRVIGLRASQFRRCPPDASNLNWKIMESGTANDRTQRAATCPARQAG